MTVFGIRHNQEKKKQSLIFFWYDTDRIENENNWGDRQTHRLTESKVFL
jgi:hypothetical protein